MFRASGDVANLRRLHLHCRNIGHKIVEHEISEMIEYLEETKTKENDRCSERQTSKKLSKVSGNTKWKSTVK
jgi:hypothetical protein